MGFLVVAVLRGHFGPSLITQKQIFGLVLAIWAITESIRIPFSSLSLWFFDAVLKHFGLFNRVGYCSFFTASTASLIKFIHSSLFKHIAITLNTTVEAKD